MNLQIQQAEIAAVPGVCVSRTQQPPRRPAVMMIAELHAVPTVTSPVRRRPPCAIRRSVGRAFRVPVLSRRCRVTMSAVGRYKIRVIIIKTGWVDCFVVLDKKIAAGDRALPPPGPPTGTDSEKVMPCALRGHISCSQSRY